MSSIQKIRTYVYDTPATYDNFTGGINTNISNEALESNELRDALNCDYKNNSLTSRKGMRIISSIIYPYGASTIRPQGDFIFSTANNKWLITVRDGFIYYGVFDEDEDETHVDILTFKLDMHTGDDTDNVQNYLIGLNVQDTRHESSSETEGYIYEKKSGDTVLYRTLVIQNTRRVQGIPATFSDDTNDSNESVASSIESKQQQLEQQNNGIDGDLHFVLATGTRIVYITEQYTNNTFSLIGKVMNAYRPNSWEIQNIGVNNLTPFPNYYYNDTENVPKTLIGQIITDPRVPYKTKVEADGLKVKAITNCLEGYSVDTLRFKWRARITSYNTSGVKTKEYSWKALTFFKATSDEDLEETGAIASSLGANEITLSLATLKKLKDNEDIVYMDTGVYGDRIDFECTLSSNDWVTSYDTSSGATTNELETEEEASINIDGTVTCDLQVNQATAQYSKTTTTGRAYTEAFVFALKYDPSNPTNPTTGASMVDEEFLKIHSCVKLFADGTKIVFYDDAYRSCEWYKSVVGVPNYISYGGDLNFRTSKNEKIVGVVVYDSNIIVFSDNEHFGGNISLVTGNGDDYNDGDYYSPYKKTIVNTSISCDAFNSIQVVDNFIIFKYRDALYLLNTNELDGTRIQVTSISDKIQTAKGSDVVFPIDYVREPTANEDVQYDLHEYYTCLKPDEIFSDVYNGVYHIVFPHKAKMSDVYDTYKPILNTTTGEYESQLSKNYEGVNSKIIKKLAGNKIPTWDNKPGLKWKCYLRKGITYDSNDKTFYPWLRDASSYLNIISTISVNEESLYVTEDNEVITFNEEDYYVSEDKTQTVSGETFKTRIRTKCYDMELPTLSKFLDNLNVYFNRDFTKTFEMKAKMYNEAGYLLFENNEEAFVNTNTHDESPTYLDEIGHISYGHRYSIDDVMPNRNNETNDYVTDIYTKNCEYNMGHVQSDKYIETSNESNLKTIEDEIILYKNRTKIDNYNSDTDLSQYEDEGYVDDMFKSIPILDETEGDVVLGRPSFTSLTLTPSYRFPFLSAQLLLEMDGSQMFTLSSMTFSFTSIDMPDSTREKLYRTIVTGSKLK